MTRVLLLMLPAAGLATVLWPTHVHACVCVVDPDLAKQRARQMANSDLVFVGSPLKSAVKDPTPWACSFDAIDVGSQPNCITVRVSSGLCQPIEGVGVVIEDEQDKKPRRAYSDSQGKARVCNLRGGYYSVEARTIRGKPVRARLKHEEGKGSHLALALVYPEEDRAFMTEFAVGTILKGPALKTVVIDTAEATGSCGFGGFSSNKQYEVFAKRTQSGRYEVDLCSGTRAIADSPDCRR